MAVTVALTSSSLLDIDRYFRETHCFHYQVINLSSATTMAARQVNLSDYTQSNEIRKSISFKRVTYISKGYYHRYYQCCTACVLNVSIVSQIYASFTYSRRLLNKTFGVLKDNKLRRKFRRNQSNVKCPFFLL